MQPDAKGKILDSSASTTHPSALHHLPHCPNKAKMLNPASQDQPEAGSCVELFLSALLILLAVVLFVLVLL